jgi:ubiquinone/menaquinone biosynthesis C-methylase UbiE
METSLEQTIQQENKNWSDVFDEEIRKKDPRKFSSFWWENYYEELTEFISRTLKQNGLRKVLEAGSGSGKATILLDNVFEKSLLDISSQALKYADYIKNKFHNDSLRLILGNAFNMPFENGSFDFVWNIGVIEHYGIEDIKLLLKEMIRVTQKNGIIAVGVPNFYSGPILKAWVLSKLKYFDGYKLSTEKFYKTELLKNVVESIARESGKSCSWVKVEYFGSPLIMETPKFIIKLISPLSSKLFKRNKFLTLIICKLG